jgi:hypothetical protein
LSWWYVVQAPVDATGVDLIVAGREVGMETTSVKVRMAARARGAGRKAGIMTRAETSFLLIDASVATGGRRSCQSAGISLNDW